MIFLASSPSPLEGRRGEEEDLPHDGGQDQHPGRRRPAGQVACPGNGPRKPWRERGHGAVGPRGPAQAAGTRIRRHLARREYAGHGRPGNGGTHPRPAADAAHAHHLRDGLRRRAAAGARLLAGGGGLHPVAGPAGSAAHQGRRLRGPVPHDGAGAAAGGGAGGAGAGTGGAGGRGGGGAAAGVSGGGRRHAGALARPVGDAARPGRLGCAVPGRLRRRRPRRAGRRLAHRDGRGRTAGRGRGHYIRRAPRCRRNRSHRGR